MMPYTPIEVIARTYSRPASTFADWERIDAEEQAAGQRFGRPRVKVATWHALFDLVRHGRPGGPLEREAE